MTAFCINHLPPSLSCWWSSLRLLHPGCAVLDPTLWCTRYKFTFPLISMCYMLASSSQIVLAFCISMLTLAKFKASHLLDDLVWSSGPWKPWWSGKESGSQIDICLLFLEISSKLQENWFSLMTFCTYSTPSLALLCLGFLSMCHERLIELMEIILPN